MARYLGATCKVSRRIGTDLGLKRKNSRDLSTKCKLNLPPGQHGMKKSRTTDYGLMLRAKQMLKLMYGVLERQFKRYYVEASRRKGATGEILLQLLERRLDNVVYRMGFASTRAEARQLVRHKSILVKNTSDGIRIINIPSYLVKVGDIIKVADRSKGQDRILSALSENESLGFSEWVEVDVANKLGIFKKIPARSDLPMEVNEQLVVELYSK